jgi:hypothetical protein
VSYDLILWRGRPTRPPAEVWRALAAHQPVEFVMPLRFADVRDAFSAQLGCQVTGGDTGGELIGRAWQLSLTDGDLYIHMTCGWGITDDAAALPSLRAAARRALCSVYDPQTSVYHDAPAFPERAVVVAPATTTPSPPGLAVGAAVHHATFGAGTVLAVTGTGDQAKARVRFAAGEKTLIARVLAPA